jgi:SNF2 family DNA or RNA helicase
MDHAFKMPPVLIVNYEALLLKKVQQLLLDYTEGRRVYLVADESIKLKNPQSKRTRVLHKLKGRFAYKRLLTGKATTQGVHDLWAQLHLIDGIGGRNFYAFRNRYCEMGGWQDRQVKGVRNADELRQLIAPFIFEAKKKDWLPGLPAKTYTTREYALTGRLGDYYAEMEEAFLIWLEEQGHDVTAEIALTKYGKLAQITCGFVHDNDGNPTWLVNDEENPRLALLLEILEDTDSKWCAVYYHKFVGLQLQRVLRNHTPALIESDMSPEQLEREKHTFNTDPTCRGIILQADVAKYGHTLLGSKDDPCYTMIFYQNTYSLDTRSQIEDRIHRIGQLNAALYVDLFGTSMDLKIVQALQKKEHIYQKLFGERQAA